MDDFDGGGGGFRSPLLMMMGAAVPVMIFFLFMTLVVPMVLYLVARSRQNREGPPDPQLGIKVALCFFRQLGYQFMLGGGLMILYGMTSKMLSGNREAVMRPALGLLVPALIVWGVHNLALQRTNRIQFPIVERLYAETVKALKSPDVAKRLEDLGLDAGGMRPEELGALVRSDIPRLGKIVRDSGARID